MENLSTLQTRLIQSERLAPQYMPSVQPPVYHASTIIFPTTDALFNRHWTKPYDYSYGTHGTPTTYTLADQIALLEGGKYCLLAPSGLSAINLVNSTFLATGDEVWLADNMYGPNLEHLQYLQKQYDIVLKIYNPTDVESFQPSERCKLLWLEAAGSVTMEFPDLVGLVKKAKSQGILTVLDNTWGAGLAFQAFDFSSEHLAVDITVHALTKYPSGGGDVLLGSIVTRDEHLHHQMLRMHALQGVSVSGDDCAQIYRSLPHMQLRYQQHHQNCLQFIAFLTQQTQFQQVLHPSLPACAGHQYWQDICIDGLGAGLVSVIFDECYHWSDIRRFCDALKVFKLGYSWGGPMSLAMLYDVQKMRQLTQTHLKKGYLVRFCIGLEHPQDLIQDVQQALTVLTVK
ncbi:MAG: PLP-dependent transferase [Acinetobacter sp.]|nr:PLP-dependent transferase [Acinetobacter sp.]